MTRTFGIYGLRLSGAFLVLIVGMAGFAPDAEARRCKTPMSDFYEPLFDVIERQRGGQVTIRYHKISQHWPDKKCQKWSRLLFETNYPIYKVYADGNWCRSQTRFRIHHNGSDRARFLKPFFVDHERTLHVLRVAAEVIERDCGKRPDRLIIHGSIHDASTYQPATFQQPSPPPMAPLSVYTGVYVIEGLSQPEFIDDDPEIRGEFMAAEALRRERENQLYRLRRQQRDDLLKTFAAITIGYIQGLTYELGDEGFCRFLGSRQKTTGHMVTRREMHACHNFMNSLLGELQADQPLTYAVSNLVGALQTSMVKLVPEQESQVETVRLRGQVGCAEAIWREASKQRAHEVPDAASLQRACAVGALQGQL
jgi:hypothetical protein